MGDFAITTSVLYHPYYFSADCPFYHFTLHILRLLRAAKYFNNSPIAEHSPGQWDSVIAFLEDASNPLLQSCLETLKRQDTIGPAKVRITIGAGTPVVPLVEFDSSLPEIAQRSLFPDIPLPPPPEVTARPPPGVFLAKLDSAPTEWKAEMEYKTTWRSHYTAARARTCTDSIKEVIIFDNAGEILEGSFTNVFFWRGNQWIGTKAGIDGTVRRWLREKKLIMDHVGLNKQDISEDGEWVLLSNGVRGAFPAWLTK